MAINTYKGCAATAVFDADDSAPHQGTIVWTQLASFLPGLHHCPVTSVFPLIAQLRSTADILAKIG